MQRRKIVTAAALLAATAAALGTAVGHADDQADVAPQITGGHEATGNTDWMALVRHDAPDSV